ncbi:hypothetical protein BBP40_006849 [Aspergillus hancockii]|nr:hypothetical protein BBP40_006849 [Aspergillus hancockii]
MPPFRTPFRVPPSRRPNSSARHSAGHQFASTPRFILSQRTPGSATQAYDDDDSINADESPESTPIPTTHVATRKHVTESTQCQKEVIEDSDDALSDSGAAHQPSPDHVTGDTEPNSSPPRDTGALDAEFEALFRPTTTRPKRRASLGTGTPPLPQRRKRDDDMIIQTSSPEAPSPTRDRGHPQGHTRPEPVTVSATATTSTPRPSTPGTIKPSFRNNPRFVISASQALRSNQPQSTARSPPSSATPAPTSPPPRRKPTFVLPRSPSPGEDPSTIPTPFSPSSHALRRRGRARSSAPSYIPGGMAAELRSWILEMGSKREQQVNRGGTRSAAPDLQKYFLVVRITDVRQSALGSSGPLAFIQGQPVTSLNDDDGDDDNKDNSGREQTRNLLLLGPPRSRTATSRTPGLLPGNMLAFTEPNRQTSIVKRILTQRSVLERVHGNPSPLALRRKVDFAILSKSKSFTTHD